jgi:outer membrane protein W
MSVLNPNIRHILIGTVAVLLAAGGASAQDDPAARAGSAPPTKVRDWTLRFGIVVAETSGSTSVEADPSTVDVRLSGGGGGFANLEYKLSPLLGLEFGTTALGLDMDVSAGAVKHWGTEVDLLSMGALTLGTNFHFIRTPSVIVYAGPMIAFNRYSKWTVRTGWDDGWWPGDHHHDEWVSVRSRTDSEVTWGAKIGIDIVLTKRGNWTFGGSLSYLDASYEFEQDDGGGRGSIGLDPLMFSFGGGFRF